VEIRYSNGPAVDRDVPQPEGLEFYHVKGRLTGASSEDPGQLLQAIDAIFSPLKVTLEHVFQEWMDRLAQYCVAIV
jgi:hypothetical protein